jgi:hypothetical protein
LPHVISTTALYDDDHVFAAGEARLLSLESVAVTFMARSGCDL